MTLNENTNLDNKRINILVRLRTSDGSLDQATRLDGAFTRVRQNVAISSNGDIYWSGGYAADKQVAIRDMTREGGESTGRFYEAASSFSTFLYLIKYDSDGTYAWATRFFSSRDEFHELLLKIDKKDAIYWGGKHDSSRFVQIYNGSKNSPGTSENNDNNDNNEGVFALPPTPGNKTNAFLIKYDASGVVQWGTRTNDSCFFSSAAFDEANNIYITGRAPNDVRFFHGDLNGGTESSTHKVAYDSALETHGSFVLKMRENGLIHWVTRIETEEGDVEGYQMFFDKADNLFLTGRYNLGTPDFYNIDGDAVTVQADNASILPSSLRKTGFIVKFNALQNAPYFLLSGDAASSGLQKFVINTSPFVALLHVTNKTLSDPNNPDGPQFEDIERTFRLRSNGMISFISHEGYWYENRA